MLSLVVPAYNERENAAEIVEFVRAIRERHPAYDFELVVVDDGSEDGTHEALAQVLQPADHATIVRLSRNFGSHAAITAGFAHAKGDAALTLSADRQEPMEAVDDFIRTWEDGADIVWGLRITRTAKPGPSEWMARGFSKIYQSNSDVPTYPREGPSQILVSRGVIDALNSMPELNRNILAMAAWTGFRQERIFFHQLPRPHGTSKWTTKKKVKLVLDSFVEFSAAPIQWLAILGMVLGATGLVALLTGVGLLVGGLALAGAATLVSGVVLLVGGLILFGLGLVGEYVWRAGDDARRRPLYLVRSVSTHE
ncbi:glycosyltransferase family 2 protein [Naasia sp. SYSU D00948]|uniref:glycosyltransferase family 2 protein n=1 Tax=Naasia sp. SYSU D00948 TaxID=2817379 RepID=UPI001FED3171|nr:glycosyltransferase family 2 protein [Naasia sp. SYSU D00948]